MTDVISSQPCDKYCMFRSANDWFGWPATEVREIGTRPEMTSVPFSDRALAGLCYMRGDFLPVFSSRALQDIETDDVRDEPRMLVLKTSAGPWGLLVDRVIGLESLQVSLSTTNRESGWAGVTLGWANHRDHMIRVLDSEALVRFVERRMEAEWATVFPLTSHSRRSSASRAVSSNSL